MEFAGIRINVAGSIFDKRALRRLALLARKADARNRAQLKREIIEAERSERAMLKETYDDTY